MAAEKCVFLSRVSVPAPRAGLQGAARGGEACGGHQGPGSAVQRPPPGSGRPTRWPCPVPVLVTVSGAILASRGHMVPRGDAAVGADVLTVGPAGPSVVASGGAGGGRAGAALSGPPVPAEHPACGRPRGGPRRPVVPVPRCLTPLRPSLQVWRAAPGTGVAARPVLSRSTVVPSRRTSLRPGGSPRDLRVRSVNSCSSLRPAPRGASVRAAFWVLGRSVQHVILRSLPSGAGRRPRTAVYKRGRFRRALICGT